MGEYQQFPGGVWVEQISGPTVALLAVKIDGTRLIDNAILEPTLRAA